MNPSPSQLLSVIFIRSSAIFSGTVRCLISGCVFGSVLSGFLRITFICTVGSSVIRIVLTGTVRISVVCIVFIVFITIVFRHDFSSCYAIILHLNDFSGSVTRLVYQNCNSLFIYWLQFLPICIIIEFVKRIYPSKIFFTINNPLLIIYTPLEIPVAPLPGFLFVFLLKRSLPKVLFYIERTFP